MTGTVHPAQKGMMSTLVGIFVNLILSAVKFIAGILGNSYALVADAIESGSDVLSSLIVFFGLKVSTIPRDENHPYGHGKAEPIAAVVVTLFLFAAAILIAVQSIVEIVTPHHTPEVFTLFVLVGVIFVKEVLFRFVVKIGDEVESTAVKTDAWHHRSDAITSVAAFVGISIAIVGGKGFELADDIAALVASAIIVFNAIRLFVPAFNEIMDSAPDPKLIETIRSIVGQVADVKATEKCFVRKMGFDFYVDIHVQVDGDMSVREGHRIAHEVKSKLMQSKSRIADVLVHIEPYSS